MLSALILGGISLGASSNVSKYQEWSENNGRASNVVWYDVDCYSGPFSDTIKAIDLKS